MDTGQYVCDVLDYNTGTRWNYENATITQYTRYPMNVYDYLSIDKKPKNEK